MFWSRHHRIDCIIALVTFALFECLISKPNNFDTRSLNVQTKDTKETHDFSNLRFLAFGTSRAWGAGLKNRLDAYPFLLHPNATNLAIRAAGCEYPSLCTMSMVGNSTYDVILIEYNHITEDKEQYKSLAKKLRHRFPDATMIFLYAWSPFQYTSLDQSSPFDIRRKLYPSPRGLREHLDSMWIDIATNSSDWRVEEDIKNKLIIHETAAEVGGYVWELPKLEDPKENLKTLGPMFLPDCTHYSIEGHKVIMQGIISILREANASQSETLGPWDSWDLCDSWFESGNTTMMTSMKMVEFKEQKHALEAPGWMQFELDRPAMLSINYMAGGPEQIYPKTQVQIPDQHDVEVIPLVRTLSSGKAAIHIVQTLPIGKIQAGVTRFELTPLEEKENPFRIVGIVLTDVIDHQPAQEEATIQTEQNTEIVNAEILVTEN